MGTGEIMKKENNDKTKDLFEAFLPDHVKDDPNENLKKEKKLFTIIFIVICSLLLAANLIAMIINFCFSVQDGVTSLFVGFINCAIGIFLLGLLIVVAHNISKMTRATMFICSKLMKDEKRYLEEKKKQDENDVKEDSEQAAVSIQEQTVEKKVDDNDDPTNIETEIVID